MSRTRNPLVQSLCFTQVFHVVLVKKTTSKTCVLVMENARVKNTFKNTTPACAKVRVLHESFAQVFHVVRCKKNTSKTCVFGHGKYTCQEHV